MTVWKSGCGGNHWPTRRKLKAYKEMQKESERQGNNLDFELILKRLKEE